MKVTQTNNGSTTLKKILDEIDRKRLAVGWGENQKYPSGDNVAMVAAQNEFGNEHKRIPPRPFMRPAMASDGKKWVNTMGALIKNAMNKKGTVSEAFEKVGLMVAADIKIAIKKVTSPALSPKTIQARKSGLANGGKNAEASIEKPLIDEGIMLNSVMFEEQTK